MSTRESPPSVNPTRAVDLWSQNSDKSKYFDSNGELSVNDTFGAELGILVKYFVVANDPDFASAKNDFVTKGMVSSADYVRMIGKFANMNLNDLPSYLRSIIDSKKFDSVTAWYLDKLTSPPWLSGDKTLVIPNLIGSATISP